jgi:hypothetical protein
MLIECHQGCECRNAAALACYQKANGGCPKPKYKVSGLLKKALELQLNDEENRNAKEYVKWHRQQWIGRCRLGR